MARARSPKLRFEQLLDQLAARFRNRLVPPLSGYVYRFTIYLPLLCEGKEVFSNRQRFLLARLFHECFAGFSETASEGNPPWYGSWAPLGARRPIVDRHTLIVLYAPQPKKPRTSFATCAGFWNGKRRRTRTWC